jgi:hypothetical protein
MVLYRVALSNHIHPHFHSKSSNGSENGDVGGDLGSYFHWEEYIIQAASTLMNTLYPGGCQGSTSHLVGRDPLAKDKHRWSLTACLSWSKTQVI